MAMVFAGPMDNGEIEWLYTGYPSRNHPLGLSEVAKARQAGMIGYHCKMPSCQVISE